MVPGTTEKDYYAGEVTGVVPGQIPDAQALVDPLIGSETPTEGSAS